MSLHDAKMSSLRDKIAEKAIEEEKKLKRDEKKASDEVEKPKKGKKKVEKN